MNDFSVPCWYDEQAVRRFCRRWRLPIEKVLRLRRLWSQGELQRWQEEWAAYGFDRDQQDRLSAPLLRQDELIRSQDGCWRAVLSTDSGGQFETMIMPFGQRRVTVCVSCQSGCAAGCTFCETARMGLRNQLGRGEILDQLRIANSWIRPLGLKVTNVVFMGMGEPFHNEVEVVHAVEAMQDYNLFEIAAKRITVSTVGVVDGMKRFVERCPRVNLAVSLHHADPEARAKLIPLTRTHRLDDLYLAILHANSIQVQPVWIQYLMIQDLTDTPAALEQLLRFLDGLRTHVNLIPFNAIAGSRWLPTARPQRDRFAARLRQAGIPVTIRYSQGQDIAGACGQLTRRRALG